MKHARKLCKKLVKDAQAVSPIIATLMLVLVAVGSAGAFYVWQSGWQTGIEDKVGGSGELQASLTIGGSSTVYEFSTIAAEYYEAANPNYRVSYQKGGSGAGVASVGMGAVDIGSASRAVKSTEFAQYPDLNKDGNKDFGRDLVVHTVAYDAVVIIYKGVINGTGYDFSDGVNASELIAAIDSGITTWFDRSDHSGTEELFVTKLLGLGYDTVEEAFADGAITADSTNSYPSNQDMLAALASETNAWTFMSFGMAEETICDYDGVTPSESTIMDNTYAAARPINYITVGDPTGDIKQYIDFCLQPENNQNICAACDYISIY